MSWYKTGTVTVTNGSATVTGAGTAFVGAVNVGDAFVGPNRQVYEVIAVVSATQLTIAPAYVGSTQSGASYGVAPTYAALVGFNARLNALLVDYESIVTGAGAGKFLNGTAALPAISAQADLDTGLFFPAANQIGTSTGGTRRTLLSNAAFQVDVPVTGTAVQQSSHDRTAGRLLTAGRAFGFGDNAPATTLLNAATEAGVYSYASTDPNAPTGNSGTVEVVRSSLGPTGITQIATLLLDASQYRRYTANSGTAWTAWRRYFDVSNILGTVASSGGVPTGAIIERGNNANGEYVLFADGTVYMNGNAVTVDVNTATGSVFMSAVQTWTLPIAASVVFTGVVSPTTSELNWGTLRTSGTSSVTWRGFRPVSATGQQFRPSVIGKINL